MTISVTIDDDTLSDIRGLTDALTTIPRDISLNVNDERLIRALESIADSLSVIARR